MSQGVLVLSGGVLGAFLILAMLKQRLAGKVGTWPTVSAEIENVFLDYTGGKFPRSYAVLAYAYSVSGGYYSGQIQLEVGERRLASLEKDAIGDQILVHYDPEKPEASIFLEDEVKDWPVRRDRRISIWSWLLWLTDKL